MPGKQEILTIAEPRQAATAVAKLASLLPQPGMWHVLNGFLLSLVPLPFNGHFTYPATYLGSFFQSCPHGFKDMMSQFEKLFGTRVTKQMSSISMYRKNQVPS